AQLHAVRLAADRQQVRRAYLPHHGSPAPQRQRRARGHGFAHCRRPVVLCDAARRVGRGCGIDDRQWLLQRSLQGIAHGVRRRSTESARREPGRQRRLRSPLMLKIDNLYASIEDKEILKGLSLDVKPGEVHAIMGPNGAGKSTLSQVLTGREAYKVTAGTVEFEGRDLLELSVEERARAGIFLAFQYPIEIPGVSNAYFMRAAVNAMRRERGLPELDAMDFVKKAKAEMKLVGMRDEFLYRSVNEGFSGGEKKRNEVLQMALLE